MPPLAKARLMCYLRLDGSMWVLAEARLPVVMPTSAALPAAVPRMQAELKQADEERTAKNRQKRNKKKVGGRHGEPQMF